MCPSFFMFRDAFGHEYLKIITTGQNNNDSWKRRIVLLWMNTNRLTLPALLEYALIKHLLPLCKTWTGYSSRFKL
jgi:hypothetical protein